MRSRSRKIILITPKAINFRSIIILIYTFSYCSHTAFSLGYKDLFGNYRAFITTRRVQEKLYPLLKNSLTFSGIFYKCKQIPEEIEAEARSLYNIYRQMELDPDLKEELKMKAMEDWMIETQKLLQGLFFNASELHDVAKIYGTDLRDGTKKLLKRLEAADVPVLVFSAGLGDVVEHILKYRGVYLSNLKIISNFLKLKDNKIEGFKNDPLIHMLNKNEHAVDKEYFKVLEGRNNVILLGDQTGDATMADGVNDCEAILKIGFLYENVRIVKLFRSSNRFWGYACTFQNC
ncbi:7-methylguanosine phosphate-specific 5'-nucleotidase [Fopius arisanus]|uniref:5'-nucleotidase n=1 Tax=Fopius arisanus TaxID=64838 RepID=A0A9R1T1D6_9HYME|nr:PREDICTED: 7-methylguanosine phosphate-specific 5'-nucleotidase [Fopius arisanus]